MSDDRLSVLGHSRCNDDLNKLPFDNGARRVGIEFSIKGNDAPKRGFAVSVKGEVIGIEQRICHGNTAGVSMFYNDTGGIIEALDALQRGVGIGHVVIGECFALYLLSTANAYLFWCGFSVKRRALMRVLAVTHLLHFF